MIGTIEHPSSDVLTRMSQKATEVPIRTRLRASITAGEVVLAPLALDALTARIAEQAGFSAVYLSGGP